MTKLNQVAVVARYRIGASLFDAGDGTWTTSAGTRVLSPRLAQVLAVLAAHAPSVVTKAALIEAVWGDRVVSESALTQRIKELRGILRDDARRPTIIETAARRGYRITVPVEVLDNDGEAGARAMLARAVAHADRFEWGKAHDLLHAAVTAAPGLAVAWSWLAFAHLWREDPDGAAAAAARAAADVAGLSERDRHFVLATHASFSGDLAEMTDQLELLLAVAPDDFWGAYRLAHAYLLAGRVADSLRAREVCARLRPDHPFNLSESGLTRLFAAGDIDGAGADYARVVALDPNHPFAMPFLIPSFTAWLAGDLATARARLDEVIDRHLQHLLPLGRVSALVHDARFRCYVGDTATALVDLERACGEVSPGSTLGGWTRLELALTLLDLGDTDRWRAEIAVVERTGTPLNRAHALLWRGTMAARAGDGETVADTISELRRTPRDSCREFGYPTARVTERVRRIFPMLVQAEAELEAGRPASALDLFTSAASALPLYLDAPLPVSTTDPRDHLQALEGMARAHAASGSLAKALAGEDWILAQRLTLFVTASGGIGTFFASLARRAVLHLAAGDQGAARRDASEVLARWGLISPPPPAARAARSVLADG
jgi:DNA-binding winged helix-turn-helix (wHTH) protein